MSKKLQNLKAQSSSVTEPLSSTQNIHTAFKPWVKKLKVYPTLVFQFGERLFIRGEDGQYASLTVRALFEVFEMQEDRKNTFMNGLIGGFMGVLITVLLFFAFGVY
ncbi:MAG: hypothetical protein RR182_01135 [Alistipes sp.]